jgi:Sec-independent protein translocase protein TatA
VFNQVGWGEIGVILLLVLFVVGPERLPGIAADAGKNLRKLRLWLKGMSSELKEELGPEFSDMDLASLHPKTFVKKHLLDDLDITEEDKDFWRKPWDDHPSVAQKVPLLAGEVPPWDPDTT